MPEELTSYRSWEQVGGYFDGDGNVRVEVLKFVLRLGVRFVDTWGPQLESIRSFLMGQGVRMGRVGLDQDRAGNRRPAYRLDVGETASVIMLVRALGSLCVKKSEDLKIALDYLEDRITGDEAASRFNDLIATGRRKGKRRMTMMPYTRRQGLRLHELTNAKRARDAHRVRVDPAVEEKIRNDHLKLGMGETTLSRKYGYTKGVLRRVLRELKANGARHGKG